MDCLTVNASGGVILDSQINVLIDSKACNLHPVSYFL